VFSLDQNGCSGWARICNFKEYERSVTVKGLSEREMPPIWKYGLLCSQRLAMNLGVYMLQLIPKLKKIKDFLVGKGIDIADINSSTLVHY
jgi:hypothetical protein